MFKDFKTILQARVKKMLSGNTTIFVTDTPGEEMWLAYLGGFPESERQGHNCNSCRSFIKHYGNMVVIVDNKVQTIWDLKTTDEYQKSVDALNILVSSKPVINVFVTKSLKLGTDYNFKEVVGGSPVRWDHFHLVLPTAFTVQSGLSEDSVRGTYKTERNVFKRSLDELTIDATETVLELVAQNSLYRGAEFKAMLDAFLKVQRQYATVKPEDKENFVWVQAMIRDNSFITKMRNTSIGTLLEDISIGTDLDVAVGKFERMMAPSNYKRPTAIFTKKMAEEAEQKLKDLGLMTALARRFATHDDITVDNLLFVNREKKENGIFESLAADQPVNPKTLSRVDSVTLDEFLANILPNSTSVELLLENKHEPNMVSLIAPIDPESASMFKWENKFSWSYNNALADSMKEKVKAAGGKVDGQLRISLEWYNYDDLDLHVIEPNGNVIYYSSKRSSTGGELDVDMNAGGGNTRTPVENVIYPYSKPLPEGKYKVLVHSFSQREKVDVGFSLEIEIGGEVYNFSQATAIANGSKVTVAEFTYSKVAGIVFTKGEPSSRVHSKEVWNLSTNKFQKVNNIMFSPNFWDGQGVGNKHIFFMLDGSENTGSVRGFFNEYLKGDLDQHRKVFEALASKVTVQPTENQLSGVGFSTTARNEFICKVTGKFARTIKITI